MGSQIDAEISFSMMGIKKLGKSDMVTGSDSLKFNVENVDVKELQNILSKSNYHLVDENNDSVDEIVDKMYDEGVIFVDIVIKLFSITKLFGFAVNRKMTAERRYKGEHVSSDSIEEIMKKLMDTTKKSI